MLGAAVGYLLEHRAYNRQVMASNPVKAIGGDWKSICPHRNLAGIALLK